MSREIKFRVWDKEKKKLLSVLEIDWAPQGYDKYGNLRKVPSYIRALDTRTRADVYHYETPEEISSILDIEQFTGLEDKNDKDIFEGDLLKFKLPFDKNSTIGQVEWSR